MAEIRALSARIVDWSKTPDFPALSQGILKRGELIHQLETAGVSALPDAQKARLKAVLQECQAMDVAVAAHMKNFQGGTEEQLKACREAHHLLDKYKVGGSGTGHKSEQA